MFTLDLGKDGFKRWNTGKGYKVIKFPLSESSDGCIIRVIKEDNAPDYYPNVIVVQSDDDCSIKKFEVGTFCLQNKSPAEAISEMEKHIMGCKVAEEVIAELLHALNNNLI